MNERTNNFLNKKDMNYERAKVFLDKKIKVHISKISGGFYNGFILEVRPDFFFIDDQEDGRQLVFFIELNKPIEEYTKEYTNEVEK